MQFLSNLQRRHDPRNRAKELQERRRVRIQIDENKMLPDLHAHWDETVRAAIEIAHALKFHHAFQRAIVSVRPTVIRATKLLGATLRSSNNGSCVVSANIVKGT